MLFPLALLFMFGVLCDVASSQETTGEVTSVTPALNSVFVAGDDVDITAAGNATKDMETTWWNVKIEFKVYKLDTTVLPTKWNLIPIATAAAPGSPPSSTVLTTPGQNASLSTTGQLVNAQVGTYLVIAGVQKKAQPGHFQGLNWAAAGDPKQTSFMVVAGDPGGGGDPDPDPLPDPNGNN